MNITLNGENRTTEAATLAALWSVETAHLQEDDGAPRSRRGFAIALNGAVVRSQAWDDTAIGDGDRVEIIRAMAGG